MKPPFKLPAKDLASTVISSASGPRSGPRSSRTQQSRDLKMTLTHVPTGLDVSGDLPPGSLTRKQMIEEEKKLKARLTIELKKLVASRLRLPER